MKLQIKNTSGKFLEVEAQAITTVEDIKKSLAEQMGIDASYLKLIGVHDKKPKVLQNDLSIGSYNISDVSKLYVMINCRGG